MAADTQPAADGKQQQQGAGQLRNRSRDESCLGPVRFEAGGQQVSPKWVLDTMAKLDWASRREPGELPTVMSADDVIALLEAGAEVLKHEPTLLELHPPDDGQLTVVGDLHGHFHDLSAMLRLVGHPSDKAWFIFNGDFVDRGVWGIEVLVTLVCWKLALPGCVHLLRGDHESSSCTAYYGFKKELMEKYGDRYTDVYRASKGLFRELPLAARVANTTLVLHGGLWRSPYDVKLGDSAEMTRLLTVGDLADLRDAGKGGLDPIGMGSSVVAADVLWSDPAHSHGMRSNKHRGLGTLWGADVSERFLRDNKLRLILRSHESPDGRTLRREEHGCELPLSDGGFSVDHDTPAGRVCTVFSSPDYPMFTPNRNRAAVVVLCAAEGEWTEPRPIVFDSLERPTERTLPFMADEQERRDTDTDLYDETEHYDLHLFRESAKVGARMMNSTQGQGPAGGLGNRNSRGSLGSESSKMLARQSIQNDIARGSLYSGTPHDEPGRPSPAKKKGGGGLFSACCGG